MTTNFSSLSTWSQDPQSPWQLLVQTPTFLLDSLDSFFLQYIVDDQIFNPSLTIIGDPETEAEFKSRLPIFRLTPQSKSDHFRELDKNQVSLLHNFQPTTALSLQDFVSRFKENTSFSLLSTDAVRSYSKIQQIYY